MIPSEVLAMLRRLVEAEEGCKLQAYRDDDGVLTIGWGHTGPEVVEGLVWTQEQADSTLASDLDSHYAQLCNCSPSVPAQTFGRQAALTDFVYNEGIGKYERSTLRSAVDVGAWQSVKVQLARWIYGSGRVLQGLVDRRNREIALIDA